MNRFLWPLIGFGALLMLLVLGLQQDARELPSPLIGKPAPEFRLPVAAAPGRHFSPAGMRGQVWLLNVWASWCLSCRQEHPALLALARDAALPLVGLNYKEVRGDGGIEAERLPAAEELDLARVRIGRWLGEHGDPYRLTVLDLDGRAGIDYGVYGVPESYVIDRDGVVRWKHVGPLTAEVLRQQLLPLLARLRGA